MRSKTDIERTIAHMKNGNCTASAATNAVWIEALEFVLGDDAHRLKYDEFIASIEPEPVELSELTPRELALRYSLLMALERLR